MYRSNIFVIIDPRNPDRNTLEEIVEALRLLGAEIVSVEPREQVIEAVVDHEHVPTVEAMGGVACVRTAFNYFAGCEATDA